MTRNELIERLAEVSHSTWMRQKSEDEGVPQETLSAEITRHDLERAEDTVAELERLELLNLD
jgi:hypothetical protein